MIEIKGDKSDQGQPLVHFWSRCVGAGRANEGLRARWQEQLRDAISLCGFEYIRFHGLFHDDMFVYRQEQDRAIYNFQYVDDLFDALLEMGIRPFVELGFCPSDLASQTGTVFWWKANGSPPKDFTRWAELVSRCVKHWMDRYGIEELRMWYFEVWNEPNLHPFFKGTRSQYFQLYKVSVEAIKALDSQLRVGGPSTSNFVPDARFDGETEDFTQHEVVIGSKDLDSLDWQPVWLKQFFAFCASEKLPVDFVSVHPYPTDWALDSLGTTKKLTRGVGATTKDLITIRKLVNASPYPNAEIHLTEWSSSPSPRDFTHDYPQAATFIVKANVESIGLVDSLSYWTFTDVFEEGGAGDTIFHGGFGMLNYQGLPKPAFHAYRLLHRLGDELLNRTNGAVLTRHRSSGKITALAYHYPVEIAQAVPASFDDRSTAEKVLATGSPAQLKIQLKGFAPDARVGIETLSPEHGNVMRAWQKLGELEPPTREQIKVLRSAASGTAREEFTCDGSGQLMLQRAVSPWSVLLVDEI